MRLIYKNSNIYTIYLLKFYLKIKIYLSGLTLISSSPCYWQIMSDRNIDEGDIEPAPKLIEVVFQNCKGHIDQWVEPYLRLTIDRLKRTEKPRLKCLLLKVVSGSLKPLLSNLYAFNSIWYFLTLSFLCQLPSLEL